MVTAVDFPAFSSQNAFAQVGVGRTVRQHCFEKHGKHIHTDAQGFKLT